MENDYFPRLSATHDVQQTNEIVNRQMEILLLLLAPLLSVMILGLPWIIRLLLSADFLPIVTMAQIAAVAMVLKAATLPVAYLTLARGRSLAYLVLETTYFLAFVLLVMWCYRQWGLVGTGIAILIAHLLDLVMIHTYAHRVFGYRFPVRTLYITGAALAMVSTALCISMFFLVD
jgi:O-antigen/teichoic acid export membrane protein